PASWAGCCRSRSGSPPRRSAWARRCGWWPRRPSRCWRACRGHDNLPLASVAPSPEIGRRYERRANGSEEERMMLRTNRVLMICATSALLAAGAEPLLAQPPAGRQGQSRQEVLRQRIMQRVLGGVPMTAQDSMVQRIVERLDFENYKALIKGLTQFGDREQGTERNERAVDWIEQQLRSWGYETERVHYEYRGEPRSQVYATKVGSTAPGEMYILGAHMDGRGGGEAANDDASGTALVMEIARVLASPDIETTRYIRFALWNNEETGLNGSRAYVEQRAALQG